jgi:hypothetical protein
MVYYDIRILNTNSTENLFQDETYRTLEADVWLQYVRNRQVSISYKKLIMEI